MVVQSSGSAVRATTRQVGFFPQVGSLRGSAPAQVGHAEI